ncbi:SDR family NAD(P)-dependent oxidoreductase [Fodinibius sediminis]|uniref:NAD(P)-dependent dehydrogenase, short-chain alcohol dehydrogenase family n=1 Tax=Fodinibius sediminis TaxID=1214077 RepID=A0A521BA85_9BACT|nr:NAD(P)-dependent dehydrogenase, short-chain alcohol dehydrogenase family [Fodinibius sediminis]
MKQLENKVSIVTGAAAGIGKATALLLAKEGAKVVVSDIAEDEGKKVVNDIENNGGKALFVKADTSRPKDHEKLVQKTVHEFGQLDIAINNAGIGGPQEPVGEYPVDGWDNVIGINLSGVFYGMNQQIPAMLDSGGGSIINMASILGSVGTPGAAGYVAAKHGVVGLTKGASLEYAAQNIRINAIGPGYIYTNLVNEETMGKEGIKSLEKLHPMGRLGEAEEVAQLVLWLASDQSSFVTGSYYPVDGGYLAQ